MRKLIVSSLLALAVLAAPACKEPDPNKFETHIERLKDSQTRNQGFSGLERLTKTVVTAQNNKDLLDEFVEKVIPAFEEVWDDSEEHHQKMLTMLRDVGRPEASSLWDRAIELDGSDALRQKTILALDGVKKARATDSAEAIIEELEKLLKDYKLDQAENEDGRLRMMMCQTLGALGDKKAVPVLIKVMEQERDTQPVTVHRAAAEALGRIGDPAAVDALLTVTFRVPDAPTTTNIGEKAKLALVAIGEPAVPGVMKMLRGEHGEVQKLAAQNDVPQLVIQQTAASILGTMGTKAAVDDLIAFMPTEACMTEEEKKAAEKPAAKDGEEGIDMDEEAKGSLRAVISDALGLIGDPKAATAMCKCAVTSTNPGDKYPIMQALGRVGGPEAVACLAEVVKTGKYDADAVAKPEFVLEPRWEAARFGILAASSKEIGQIKEAMATNKDKNVQAQLAAWDPAIEMVEKCGDDKGCYLETLNDTTADWFAREKAAVEVAKASPGDLDAAEAIAKAYKVRNPDARVTMAWLPTRILEDKKCPKCVEAWNGVLEDEKLSMAAEYQGAVLRVRASIARLQDTTQADAAEASAE